MRTITQSSRKSFPFKLVLVLLIAWALLVIRLSAPWYGAQDSFRVWIPAAVRNFDWYGVETTGLMVIRNSAPVAAEEFIIYSHHPPLVAWIPALVAIPFGFNELAIRFGFAAASLITVAGLFVLARRLYGEPVAILAALLFTVTPMIAYFGRIPGHDPLGMAAGVLFAVVIVNWLRQPNRARLLALGLLAWTAAWTAWPAVFFVGALGLAAFILGNRAQRLAVIGLGALTVLAVVTLFAFYQSQWSGSIDSILDAFVWRISDAAGTSDQPSFTMLEFFARTMLHLIVYATLGLIALSLIGIAPVIRHGTRFSLTILLALFAAGMGYQLVFRNASYIHDYYKGVLMPAMVIPAAAAWVYTRNRARHRRFVRPLIDGLLLTVFLAGGIVLAILHSSGRQPMITAIINTVNAEASPEQTVMVMIEGDTHTTSTGYNRVVEFYTERAVQWEVTPDEALNTARSSERVLYIYCTLPDERTLPDTLATLDAQPVYEDRCFQFDLSG